jgi:hypothetical protein
MKNAAFWDIMPVPVVKLLSVRWGKTMCSCDICVCNMSEV